MAIADTLAKIYRPLGFSKTYNFILFFNFAGAMFAFVLARLPFLNFDGQFCRFELGFSLFKLRAAPGECYTYEIERGAYRVSMILHLATVLPAMALATFQFLPIMRHKLMIMHRIDGYIVIVLFLISNASAVILARETFGGAIETQTIVGLMALTTTMSVLLAYYNIKRLQIEQHRAWMLRTFFYAGSIITSRMILVLAAMYESIEDKWYYAQPCYRIAFEYAMARHPTVDRYPECEAYFNGTNPEQRALVNAVFLNPDGTIGKEQQAASLEMNFGMSLWLAFFIHVIGVEIYLQLTPAEHNRLRQVSYEKQLAAGFKDPGYSGTTLERFGDTDTWMPEEEKEAKVIEEAI